MNKNCLFLFFCSFVLANFTNAADVKFKTSTGSVAPGSKVTIRTKEVSLSGGTFKEGSDLSKVVAQTLNYKLPTGVTLLSIVPSIDTPVCETQTHLLGENKMLNPMIKRVTISRDLPMAQERFAEEARLSNITYLSDYKNGEFGKKTGLLLSENQLLARALIVLDQEGKVRYYQIVPEVSELPDMDRAVQEANKLLQ